MLHLVRPRLEFASPVWTSYYKAQVYNVGRVQLQFLKTISKMNGLTSDRVDSDVLDSLNFWQIFRLEGH